MQPFLEMESANTNYFPDALGNRLIANFNIPEAMPSTVRFAQSQR
jgi:hypothetical protein